MANEFIQLPIRPVTIENTPLPVIITSANNTLFNQFNQINSVPNGVKTLVLTYTVPIGKTLSLDFIDFGGENISIFTVEIDGTTQALKRTYFGGPLFDQFDFRGIIVNSGSTVNLFTKHSRPNAASFEGRIVGGLT